MPIQTQETGNIKTNPIKTTRNSQTNTLNMVQESSPRNSQHQRQLGNQTIQRLIHSGAYPEKHAAGNSTYKYGQDANRLIDRMEDIPKSLRQVTKNIDHDTSSVSQYKQLNQSIDYHHPHKFTKKNIRLEQPHIQPKLSIGDIDDEYEREADAVADRVLKSPIGEINDEVDNTNINHSTIQRKSNVRNQLYVTPLVSKIVNSPGHGIMLPMNIRLPLERELNTDLSHIRIHNNKDAQNSAASIKAKAYTHQNNIFLGKGQSTNDLRLMAHEATHVIQQTGFNRALRTDKTNTRTTNKPNNTIQRTPEAEQVIQALSVVDPIAGVGDFSQAFRILAALTMSDLIVTLDELEVTHNQLDQLRASVGTTTGISSINRLRLIQVMTVIRLSHGPAANLQLAHMSANLSGLPAADITLLINYLRPLAPAVPTSRTAGQRAAISSSRAAAIPNNTQAREIGFALDPSSRPAPAPPSTTPGAPPPPTPPRIPWDGTTGAAGSIAARATMQTELFAAYDAYLTHFLPSTTARLIQPRVDFVATRVSVPTPTGVVDIANQAQTQLERRYATTMNAATRSATQRSDRSARVASGAGQNIFDSSVEADRRTMRGGVDLAPGVAWWLFENDTPGAAGAAGSRTFATDILAAHNYSAADAGAETYRWDVARAYATASTIGTPDNRRELINYRMTGWSEKGLPSLGITIQSRFTPGADPSRAELLQRWSIFSTATHESLHLRTHPAFKNAERGRGSMTEGFTEMFTIDTLNTDILPRVRAGNMESLRMTVEGDLSPMTHDPSLMPNRSSPTQYVPHRRNAELIRDDPTFGVGEAAVRAAYFQGHVEFIGLDSGGSTRSSLSATGAARQIRIPGGITGLDDLARRSGVSRTEIERANPGITDALPATAILTGSREHWVITGESRANIAAQNGVSESALVRANPDIALDIATNGWPTLSPGYKVLVPVR